MNADPIARFYRTFEYLAFGRKLERARFQYLSECRHATRALLFGDGDGRFLEQLLKTNPAVRVVSVEMSREMLSLARARVRDSPRVQFVQADALTWHHDGPPFDLVVTQFFLDCFTDDQLRPFINRVRRCCAVDARWLVSEFQQPPAGWRKWHARLWLFVMYRFFSVVTGLSIRVLPHYERLLKEAGFAMALSESRMAGLIQSQLWTPANTFERETIAPA